MVADGSALVSVVVPTFRRSDRLQAVAGTVLAQTHRPLELIIVDDNGAGSAGQLATQEVMDSLRRQLEQASVGFQYEVLERNAGAPAARNRGAAIADGEYLSFLDDDDGWLPEKLESQLRLLEAADSRVGLVYTGLRVVNESGEFLKERRAHAPANPVDALARQNVIGTVSSALIPRAVFASVGGFDEALPARQDLDLWLRIAEHWRVLAVDLPLTVYVNHPHGISKDFSKKIEAHDRFLEKHRGLYEADRSLMAAYHYGTALLCGKHARYDLARKYLWQSVRARFTLKAGIRLFTTMLKRAIPERS